MLERTVEIQISNKTRNITLENPRTYFFNGHCSVPPRPSVPPGSNDSCTFSNSWFKGCVGVLAYEAASFTLAIFFCNPLDYNLHSMVLGLELSVRKSHLTSLEDTYTRMATGAPVPDAVTASDRVTLDSCHQAARVSAGAVRAAATMSNDRRAVVRLVLEGWESSPGMETGMENPGKGERVVV